MRPTSSHSKLSHSYSPPALLSVDSSHKSSSLYSDDGGDVETKQEEEPGRDLLASSFCNRHKPPSQQLRKRPTTLGLDRNLSAELATTLSKTSSSLSAERFKYDDQLYSEFLQAPAECEAPKLSEHAGTGLNSPTRPVRTHNRATSHRCSHEADFYNPAAIQSS